jgi:MFS-type transporter involved in bile tolerance (Atg22 family)
MMEDQTPTPERKRNWRNLALAGVVGQVGCLTLVIVLGAVLGGLWLDARFQTRPMMTMILVIASIPISLALMFALVRAATARIQANLQNQKK